MFINIVASGALLQRLRQGAGLGVDHNAPFFSCPDAQSAPCETVLGALKSGGSINCSATPSGVLLPPGDPSASVRRTPRARCAIPRGPTSPLSSPAPWRPIAYSLRTDSPATVRKRKKFCRFFLPVGNSVPQRPIAPLAARAKPATRCPALGQNGNAPSAARPGETRFPSPDSARDRRSASWPQGSPL
jgi:hypothetical protein